MQIW